MGLEHYGLAASLTKGPMVILTLPQNTYLVSQLRLRGLLAKNKEANTHPKSSPCDQGTAGDSVRDLP